MAKRLGDISMRMNLYRNTTRGKIAGVCAGISDRMGIKSTWVRIAFVAFALLTHGFGIVLYLLLAIVLQPREEATAYAPPGYGGYAGAPGPMPVTPMGPPPGARVMDVKTRFTAIDARLSRIEAVITSNELSLRRKFRDLGSD
jgi:phage shock protein C